MQISFDQVRDVLSGREWELSAGELHGSLCGFLSARGALRELDWLDVLLDAAVSTDLSAAERAVLMPLGLQATQALEEGELGFTPLLPADDAALELRVDALGQWCDGFVGGLGLGGLDEEHGLSATGREAVEDLGRIARTEMTLDGDEEDEAAFVEVLEFVRIGVILVYEELRATRLRHRSALSARAGHGRHRPH